MLTLPPDHPRPRRAYEPHETTRAWVASAKRRLALASLACEGEPTPRLHVTCRQLVEAINADLAEHPLCDGISVRASNRLQPLDEAPGCNWLPSALIVELSGFAGPESFRALDGVVAGAARRYLLDDSR